MRQRIQLSAIAGLCGLLLLIPVVLLDYVVTPSALANSNPQLYGFGFWLYALFGLAVILFLNGFASLAREHGDVPVRLTSRLLILAYVLELVIGVLVFYSSIEPEFARLADVFLICARAVLYVLLGGAILYSSKIENGLKIWVSICAMLVGIAMLSQLTHGNLDDFASVPFLITGATMLLQASTE